MFYVEKIEMLPNRDDSSLFTDIKSLYIDFGKGLFSYKKEIIYDYLDKAPNSIKVPIGKRPFLIPFLDKEKNKHVLAFDFDSKDDMLIKLPRVMINNLHENVYNYVN